MTEPTTVASTIEEDDHAGHDHGDTAVSTMLTSENLVTLNVADEAGTELACYRLSCEMQHSFMSSGPCPESFNPEGVSRTLGHTLANVYT